MRRLLRSLSTAMIVAGALLLADVGVTLAWQEPGSAVYAWWQQRGLNDSLQRLDADGPDPLQLRALAGLKGADKRMAFLARSLRARANDGQAIARIEIPRIGVSKVVVQGTGTADLQKGPGHFPGTPLPGMRGTVGIAGHRTTYGAPFRKINKLRPHDAIRLRTSYGIFTYRVERTRIVPPTAVWVTDRRSYNRLVLSACHPLYSAAKRIVVFARLQSAKPRGAALRGV